MALYTLLFNFGRYLLFASSRPGSTAASLQGIWNNRVKAPWNSNYTANINTEMNYWPVLPCNLPELMTPLVELIQAVSHDIRTPLSMVMGYAGQRNHSPIIWPVRNIHGSSATA